MILTIGISASVSVFAAREVYVLEKNEEVTLNGILTKNEKFTEEYWVLNLKKNNVVTITFVGDYTTNLKVGIINKGTKTLASSKLKKENDSVTVKAPKDGAYKVYIKNNRSKSSNYNIEVSYK